MRKIYIFNEGNRKELRIDANRADAFVVLSSRDDIREGETRQNRIETAIASNDKHRFAYKYTTRLCIYKYIDENLGLDYLSIR